jgi:hypothetical protein
MIPKIEITHQVLKLLEPNYDEKLFQRALRSWWVSTRKKESGGLKLTDLGFTCFQRSGIKSYRVQFEEPIDTRNQLIIWLDNHIDCPWYLTKDEIFVYNEKMAIQLVLFAGNVEHFVSVKAKNQKSS